MNFTEVCGSNNKFVTLYTFTIQALIYHKDDYGNNGDISVELSVNLSVCLCSEGLYNN